MSGQLDKEVDIRGTKYLVTRMSAYDQMHVATDYRDILMAIAMNRQANSELVRERNEEISKKGKSAIETMSADAESKAAQMMIMSRAGMSPETRGRAMNICLSHVRMKQPSGWAPVLAAPDTMQFDSVDLFTLVPLLLAVFEHNRLVDFFVESLSSSDGQTEQNTDGRA